MTGRNRFHIQTEALRQQDPEERLLLIDTDAGTDDAWAIFMALMAHKAFPTTGVRIVGFTSTCGNTKVNNVSINVTRSLDTLNENSIPIYEGMGEFMTGPFFLSEVPPYHGEDGFGDADLPPIDARLESEHAVMAIIKLAELYKGRLTIVALGPLTNLAMAVKLKPEIKNYIREIFILGGNMHGQGNVTPAAEFNFFMDPEAVAVCVDNYPPCPLIIVPWETGLTATSTKKFRMETLGVMNTPQIQLLNPIEAHNLGRERDTWLPPDAVVMACAINPKIILASEEHFAQGEVNGTHTRGMLVVDKGKVTENPPNVRLITELDVATYEDYLIWTAGGPPPPSTSKAPSAPSRSLVRTRNSRYITKPYSLGRGH